MVAPGRRPAVVHRHPLLRCIIPVSAKQRALHCTGRKRAPQARTISREPIRSCDASVRVKPNELVISSCLGPHFSALQALPELQSHGRGSAMFTMSRFMRRGSCKLTHADACLDRSDDRRFPLVMYTCCHPKFATSSQSSRACCSAIPTAAVPMAPWTWWNISCRRDDWWSIRAAFLG